jgi:hypothetical protein
MTLYSLHADSFNTASGLVWACKSEVLKGLAYEFMRALRIERFAAERALITSLVKMLFLVLHPLICTVEAELILARGTLVRVDQKKHANLARDH